MNDDFRVGDVVIANDTYRANNTLELSFEKAELLLIISETDADTFCVQNADKKVGTVRKTNIDSIYRLIDKPSSLARDVIDQVRMGRHGSFVIAEDGKDLKSLVFVIKLDVVTQKRMACDLFGNKVKFESESWMLLPEIINKLFVENYFGTRLRYWLNAFDIFSKDNTELTENILYGSKNNRYQIMEDYCTSDKTESFLSGTECDVIGETENSEWCLIETNGKTCFVPKRCLCRLPSLSWYHGNLERSRARDMLRNHAELTFLFCRDQRVRNLISLIYVEHPDKLSLKYIVLRGNRVHPCSCHSFNNLKELVDQYPMTDKKGLHVYLKHPLSSNAENRGQRYKDTEQAMNMRTTNDQDWHHCNLTTTGAYQLLQDKADGTFLITENPENEGIFSLLYRNDGETWQIQIEKKGFKFNILDCSFDSLTDLVAAVRTEAGIEGLKGNLPSVLHALSFGSVSPIQLAKIPEEVLEMDNDSVLLYLKALNNGTEKCRNVRIMIVGHFGVGKTCLTRKLLGAKFKYVDSTNGIDIHVRRCRVNLESGYWNCQIDLPYENYADYRLLEVLGDSVPEEQDDVLGGSLELDTANQQPMATGDSDSAALPSNVLDDDEHRCAEFSSATDGEAFSLGNLAELPTNKNDKVADKKQEGVKPENEKQSHIIERQKHELTRLYKTLQALDANDVNCAHVSIWDFAGQFVFYATHPIFFTQNAVYLHVHDISRKLEEEILDEEFPLEVASTQTRSLGDFARMWMFAVYNCQSEEAGTPPVFLVGTHKDKVEGTETEKTKYAELYFEEVRRMFDGTPVENHIQAQQFFVDNTNDDEDVEGLRLAIMTAATKLPCWERELPAKWIPLEKSLSELSASGRKIVTLQDVEEVDRHNDIPLGNRDEIKLFFRYHYSMGTFVYVDEDDLDNKVILDPQWLIDAFKCLITAKMFCKIRPKLRALWQDLHSRALLRKELALEVWLDQNPEFYDERESLLQFMDKLDIIAKPRVFDDEGAVKESDYYLVPSLLRLHGQESLTLIANGIKNRSSTLCYKLDEGYFPVEAFHKLLAASLSRWSLFETGEEIKLFSQAGLFKCDGVHVVFLELHDEWLKVTLMKLTNTEIERVYGDRIRRFVAKVLEKELSRIRRKPCFRWYTQCRTATNKHLLLHDCEELLQHGCLRCLAHQKESEMHDVDAVEYLRVWFPDRFDKIRERAWFTTIPEEQRNRPVSDKELSRLSHCIGANWELIGLSLGLSQAQIEHAKLDNPYTTALQIYAVLKKWKIFAEDATLEILVEALVENPRVTVDWDRVKNIVDKF